MFKVVLLYLLVSINVNFRLFSFIKDSRYSTYVYVKHANEQPTIAITTNRGNVLPKSNIHNVLFYSFAVIYGVI